MASRILLNDGSSFLLRNAGEKLLLNESGFLAKNNGTDKVVKNDGTSRLVIHNEPANPAFRMPAAVLGDAAEFLNFSDHLESTAPVAPDLYTVCYWARLKKPITSGAQQATFSIENTAGTSYLIHITTLNASTIEAHDSTNGGFLFTGTDTSGDGWYFIAETNDFAGGPTTKLYWQRDGLGPNLNLTTGNNHVTIPTVNVLYIGTDSAGGQNEFFRGGINRMRFWNVVLTQSELEAEMASATAVKTANLWADYPLAPGASFLNDVSGNARNLTNPSGIGAWQTIPGPSIGATQVVSGSIAETLDAATSSASGTFTSGSVTGTVAATLADATSSAAGTFPFTGASAQTLAAATSTASGALGNAGTVAQTLAAVTSSASGALGNAGTVAATLASVSNAASGTFPFTGTSAQTLAAVTDSATGSHTPYTGTVAVTLTAATSSASGTFTVTGTSAQTLGAATSTATGSFTSGSSVTGAAAATLDAVSSSASGTHTPFTGTSSTTLDSALGSATGIAAAVGALASTLASLTGEATGTHAPYGGSVDATLDAVTGAASGTVSMYVFFVVSAKSTAARITTLSTTSAEVTGPNDAVLGG